jgi:serine/threonine protein kinase
MLAGYLPFDDDPANPEGDNINLLYKYIVSTPLIFPDYVTPHARDLLKRILVPDPRKRADLFEIARHSWLSEYAHVVGFITSSTTTTKDIANATVPSCKFSHRADVLELLLTLKLQLPTKFHILHVVRQLENQRRSRPHRDKPHMFPEDLLLRLGKLIRLRMQKEQKQLATQSAEPCRWSMSHRNHRLLVWIAQENLVPELVVKDPLKFPQHPNNTDGLLRQRQLLQWHHLRDQLGMTIAPHPKTLYQKQHTQRTGHQQEAL